DVNASYAGRTPPGCQIAAYPIRAVRYAAALLKSLRVKTQRRAPLFRLGQQWQYAFGEPVGLFEMWISRQDEFVEAQRVVFGDQVRDFLVATDQCGARAATHQAHPGPKIRVDLKFVDLATVQRRHPPLSLGFRTGMLRGRFGDL